MISSVFDNADMISSVFDNMVSKGADGPQSLAMATWQICGGRRGRDPGKAGYRRRKVRGTDSSRCRLNVGSTMEAGMKIFAWIFAAAISLVSLPALAGSPAGPDGSIVLTDAGKLNFVDLAL